MKRLVVLGGTGMAGNVAVRYLEQQGNDIYYMALDAQETSKSKALDATDISALSSWLDTVKPDVIFNCLGLLIKASENRPDLAILLNSYLPHYLEQKYANTSVKIIHLSTDCVFSGKRGGYLENDIPDGETIYDRSKALGEIINDKDLTFRMSIIGPDQNESGVGLFNWFMSQTGKIRGFTKAMWTGITTIELARAVDAALQQDLTGLYHLVPDKPIDKYSLLLLFKDVFNRMDVEIEPQDEFIVDKTLVNTRKDFDFKVRDYKQQIEDMQKWIEEHKELYKHY
ncbi:MAG: SDR family oxidoreductase [Oscillospiraceae bacterium]|nr:SDR family oxidoreductase [Oscillospiraceae bacterium]